ncbi:MAG: hypothetical protein RSB84_07370 [Erysipelotrichaceae bacterium]
MKNDYDLDDIANELVKCLSEKDVSISEARYILEKAEQFINNDTKVRPID